MGLVAEHRRQEDDRDVAGLAPLADEAGCLVAVHAGHVQVQQDDREILDQQAFERLVSGTGQDDLVTQLLQRAGGGEQVTLVIVDDQHPRAQPAAFRAEGRRAAGDCRNTRGGILSRHTLSSPAASGSRCCPTPVVRRRPGGQPRAGRRSGGRCRPAWTHSPRRRPGCTSAGRPSSPWP